ncbi:hypothetical protein KKG56_11955, partial [bacterium]|nr:hypothetical protein [bacterium]
AAFFVRILSPKDVDKDKVNAGAGMTEEFQTVIPAPAFTGVNSCRNLPIKLSKINVMVYYYISPEF